jgi:hypothetical protein
LHPRSHRLIFPWSSRTDGLLLRPSIAAASPLPSTLPATIHTALLTSLSLPTSTSDLSSHITSYLSSRSTSPSHILAAARALHRASTPIADVLFGLLSEQIETPLKTAVSGLHLLESWRSERAEEFRASAKARWTLARVLDTKEEKEARKKESAPASGAANGDAKKDGEESKAGGDL